MYMSLYILNILVVLGFRVPWLTVLVLCDLRLRVYLGSEGYGFSLIEFGGWSFRFRMVFRSSIWV